MKKNTLGIVFSNMHDETLGELTDHRTTASIPFGGRYRLIDFTLSNMVNSGISEVGIITKNNYQSLMDHLGSGRDWDLARKRGGLCILPPFGNSATGIYRGRLEAIAGIMSYIKGSNAQYVIMSDSDIVANIDFSDLLDRHISTKADITLVYNKEYINLDCVKDIVTLEINNDSEIIDVLVNPDMSGEQNVYRNIAVMRKELLEDLAKEAISHNIPGFINFVLQGKLNELDIKGYKFDNYVAEITGMKAYFKTNMELLNSDIRKQLFPKDRPVYTKVRDEVPVKYGLNSIVKNSLIADGCIIEGTVENSIIFRGVKVGKGAIIKNSIVMQSSIINKNAKLEYVITDKDVTICENRNLSGSISYPVYISKGSKA